eukprot:1835823-Pyramimonas_sp.AAC.1
MGEKRKDWRALWTDAVDDADAITHMLQQLHGDSRRDPLPPLEWNRWSVWLPSFLRKPQASMLSPL